MKITFFDFRQQKWLDETEYCIYLGLVFRVWDNTPDTNDQALGDAIEGFVFNNGEFVFSTARRNGFTIYPESLNYP